MKPNTQDVLQIMEMKAQAAVLYEEIDRRITEIKAQYGVGRFDFDLEEFLDEYDGNAYDERIMDNGRYLKLEIKDNAQALQNGEAVFTSVSFKPVSFSTSSLKRCPESLK